MHLGCQVLHLPFFTSDHCPILINTSSLNNAPSTGQFFWYEQWWILELDFESTVCSLWTSLITSTGVGIQGESFTKLEKALHGWAKSKGKNWNRGINKVQWATNTHNTTQEGLCRQEVSIYWPSKSNIGDNALVQFGLKMETKVLNSSIVGPTVKMRRIVLQAFQRGSGLVFLYL